MTVEPELNRARKVGLLGLMCIFTVLLPACDKLDLKPENNPVTDEAMDRAKEVLDKSKETAEDAAGNVADWSEEDLRKIGAWEYKIVRFEDLSDEALEEELNSLGDDRWECYWVEETAEGPRFYFRKTKRSYLRHVPVGDLLKFLVPDGTP